MVPIVVYDACVLYPAPLRDLLVRIAAAGIVRARWTDEILDECFRAILQQRTDLDADALTRTRILLVQAIPESTVDSYDSLIPKLQLPDLDDRHVLAAAITCGAGAIVTMNLRDFPDNALSRYGITAVHPDNFVLELTDRYPDKITSIIAQQSSALRRPSMSTLQLLERLEHCGLKQSSLGLRKLLT